jgi:hypothetical protein
MPEQIVTPQVSKAALWTGRVLSAAPALMLLTGGINAFFKSPQVIQGITHLGFPLSTLVPLCILEIVCAVLYLIPSTAILGAILLTGYFGGAVASHVRVGEGMFVIPVLFGVLVWLGLYLRNPLLRTLIPLRSSCA